MKLSALPTAALVAGTLIVSAAPAFADKVDWRQYNQQRRIDDGVRSGQLNRWEYQRLQGQQARIAQMERWAKRDGYVDPFEREQLRRAQNEASRSIYRQKHDDDRRWRPWHRRWW